MEVELKLLVESKFKDALLRHPLLSTEGAPKPHEQKQTDTYFDTPDLQLRNRSVGLRVRHADSSWIQNVKSGGSVQGGLHSRHEWELPVSGPAPELARLRDLIDNKKIWRDVLGVPALRKSLGPVFTTKVKRIVWNLHLQDGAHIECALDQGTLEYGGKKVPISELELELKSGDPRELFDLALGLQKDIPMYLGNRSKADRGYSLISSQPDAAVKATRLALSTDMTVEQAFQAIASNCISHMENNDQNVAQRHDVESLHQMRVGMRRLRSALGMFKGLLHLPDEIQKDLDWLV